MPRSRQAAWLGDLERILEELAQANITQLQLEDGDTKLFIRRRGQETALAPVSAFGDGGLAEGRFAVVSPLTGVFYPTASPRDEPLVKVGDFVAVGQVVGIVEAMKLFNEVRADRSGQVVAILARSGDLVHQGETLMLLQEAAP